jgi:hypothetical protein
MRNLNLPIDDPTTLWTFALCVIILGLLVAVAYGAGAEATRRSQQTQDEIRKQHATEWPDHLPDVAVKPAPYKVERPAAYVREYPGGYEVVWQSRRNHVSNGG